MKVLLIQDVYKLGRAGEVKKVANGYGRNYLIPQGLAVMATAGALKQAEYIREKANEQRAILNKEMEAVAQLLEGTRVTFGVRASETGRLYGSVTTQMIADALNEQTGVEVDRRQVDSQPLRTLDTFEIGIRLTVDLIPTVSVVVHREGESPDQAEAEREAEESAEPTDESAAEAADAEVEVEPDEETADEE